MKKLLPLLLSLLLLTTLCACNAIPAASSVSVPPSGPDLLVGFGRADISPTTKLALGGYGDFLTRKSKKIVNEEDRLYATCVAITDNKGETVLMYTNDLLRINEDWMPALRQAITDATGVPADRIMIAATHTHSAPEVRTGVMEQGSDYYNLYLQALVTSGTEAMADRAEASIQTGSMDTEGMVFIRHYNLADGTIGGSNFGTNSAAVSHVREANQRLQLVRFVREDTEKKDVLLVNWQGHPVRFSDRSTSDGAANYNKVSADYIGYCRSFVEANTDCLFAFFLNASGDSVTKSRIPAVNADCNVPPTARGYGEKLGGYVLDTMNTMTDLETGTLSTKQQIFYGRSIKAPHDATVNLELNVIALGELSFFTAPYEMVDIHTMYIRDNSPYTMTFGITLANGLKSRPYITAKEVYEYAPDAYEAWYSAVDEGVGDELADAFLTMLKELHG